MKNKGSVFFLVLVLMMLINAIAVSAALSSEVQSPIKDKTEDNTQSAEVVVTHTDAAPRYWSGWQLASVNADAQVFEDEEMTTPLDLASVKTGNVIICESKGDINKIRIGSRIGWVAKDSLITVDEPVKYAGGDAVIDPVSVNDTEIAAELDKIAKDHGCVGAQVAVIKNGQISHLYEYGYQDKYQKIPLTSATKIRVASTSKIIVGMGAMSMQDMGILDMNADISTYWGQKISNPNHPDTPITMSNLLTHTSSFKDFGYKKRATSALEENLRNNDSFTKHKPGDPAGYKYNNSGICAAGAIAGRAADVNFDRYIREYFFGPLNIDASFNANNIRGQDKISTVYNDGTTTIRVEDML